MFWLNSFWLNALLETFALFGITLLISIFLGWYTAITAWWSNNRIAFFAPLLFLSVPSWLFGFILDDLITINRWLAAGLSLGITGATYFHIFTLSALLGSSYKNYQMLIIHKNKKIVALLLSIKPALFASFIPSSILVFSETLTDFGVANYFGIQTLTVNTYNLWSSAWNFDSISWGFFLLFSLSLITLFRFKPNTSFSDTRKKRSSALTLAPVILFLTLCVLKSISWGQQNSSISLQEAINSLILVGWVVFFSFIAVLLCLNNFLKLFLTKLGMYLYSVPGILVGLTFLIFTNLSLYVSIVAGITLRYFGLMVNNYKNSEKSNNHLVEAVVPFLTKTQVIKTKLLLHKHAILMSVCLVALEVLKELPISMLLSPLNFTTLAMRLNYTARTENLNHIGYNSLLLILIGFFLALVLMKISNDSSNRY